MTQASPFCPNIAATPDGEQVWFTLKDTGKTQVFDARPPFTLLKTLDTGPITNHVNFVRNAKGQFAYVTVGGLNEVKVFRTDDFSQVATIPVGKLPHGIWPSGDGTRIYVGLENDDAMAAIDTLTNTVIATIPIGQAPQAVAYVPDAVPEGDGTRILQPLGAGGHTAHLTLAPLSAGNSGAAAPTSVSLFDQGLIQVLGGLRDRARSRSSPMCWRCRGAADGTGPLEPLAELHDQPGGRGDRQRRRADPADRAGRWPRATPLSHHCVRHSRQAWSPRPGPDRLKRRRRANRSKPPDHPSATTIGDPDASTAWSEGSFRCHRKRSPKKSTNARMRELRYRRC